MLEIKGCDAPVDVAFVMDSSGSIRNDYQKEKDIVKAVARSLLGASGGDSRAGIVLYSENAYVKATFEQYNSLDDFHNTIDKLPLLNRGTRIDRALQKAKKELFSTPRNSVASVAIVLTDGKQDDGAGDLEEASEPLRAAGVHILAVGIGNADEKELRSMTDFRFHDGDDDDDVIKSDNFEELKLKVHDLAKKACRKASKYSSLVLAEAVSRAYQAFFFNKTV